MVSESIEFLEVKKEILEPLLVQASSLMFTYVYLCLSFKIIMQIVYWPCNKHNVQFIWLPCILVQIMLQTLKKNTFKSLKTYFLK